MKVHQGRWRLNQKKKSTIFIVSNKWLMLSKIQKGCKRIEFFLKMQWDWFRIIPESHMSLQSCLWIVPPDILPLSEGLFRTDYTIHVSTQLLYHIVHPLRYFSKFVLIFSDFTWTPVMMLLLYSWICFRMNKIIFLNTPIPQTCLVMLISN